MSTDKPTAARVYLSRVRTALADLPANEIEELLEDVRPQLAEMEAESGAAARVEDLVARLGTPESYAAELRASGGYPPAPEGGPAAATEVLATAKPGRIGPRLALWGLVFCAAGTALVAFTAAVRFDAETLIGMLVLAPVFAVSLAFLLLRGPGAIRELPEVVRARAMVKSMREDRSADRAFAYLNSLKPAWWVVCAFALLAFGLLMMIRDLHAVLLLPVLLVAAGLVMWAGPRSKADRRMLWIAVPVSAFVVGSAFGGLGAAVKLVRDRSYTSHSTPSYASSMYQDSHGNESLRYGQRELTNLYVFDANGKPLENVYLYDDRGRPLTITRYGCEKDTGTSEMTGEDNQFPRPKVTLGTQDDRGNVNGYNGYRSYCREDAGVPFAAVIPKPPATSVPPTPASPAKPPQPTR
ncbi:HAAS signaling domain-containing protein [Amycolatopsis sp. WGS_07]|uniref:HAAS signaling domain-containing protein n=1 Tax=Amycolatopsis sp. WGS_07 TaxID=3076764 RepID=UPI003872ADD5